MTLPRVVNGMHIANSKQYDVEKCIASAKGVGCVTILHHLMYARDEVAGQWGDVENRWWYGKLRWGWPAQGIPPAPELLIHVRMFHPDWRALDPKAWASHTVRMLSSWQDPDGRRANLLDDPFVCVSPANEQDIESRAPGTGANSVAEYAVIGQWCLDWVTEFDRLAPGRKCLTCWPAFAGGHDALPDDPDSEYSVAEVKAAMALYDLGAVHLYGHAEWGPTEGPKTLPGGKDAVWHMLRAFRPKGWRDANQPSPNRPRDRGGFCAQFPDKPFIVSESGTFGHADKALTNQTIAAWTGLLAAAASSGTCLGVTPFIWNSDAAHPTNTIWDNEQLRNAAPNLQPHATAARVPVRGVAVPPPGVPTMPSLGDALYAEFGAAFEDLRTSLPSNPGGPNGPFSTRSLSIVKALAFHHTAGPKSASWADIARGHVARGWAGIGYAFGIRSGKLSYLGDVGTSRANVADQNPWVIGICFAGDYSTAPLAPEDAAIARRLVKVLDVHLGRELPCEPHSKWVATACPGGTVRALLPTLRAATAPAPPPAGASLGSVVLAAGAAAQKIRLNRDAAIQRVIAEHGYCATSNEYEVTHDGARYIGQLAEHLATGRVRAYIVKVGDWANVGFVDRP